MARFAQTLGFSGYRELRVAVARTVTLAQAQRRGSASTPPRSTPTTSRRPSPPSSPRRRSTRSRRRRSGLDAEPRSIASRAPIVDARHVDLFGQAASSLTAQDLQQKLVRIGCSVAHSADPHLALTTASLRTPGDVAIAFSHGGETQEVVRAVEVAQGRRGALGRRSPACPTRSLALAADVVLLTYAQESPFRMAAMSSRIAQLALVDVLFVRIVQHRGEPVVIPLQLTHDAAASRRRH